VVALAAVKSLLQVLFLALALGGAARAQAPDPGDWQRAVEILQYLESDYPAAVQSGEPSELDEQKSFAKEALAAVRALGASGQSFGPRLESVLARIEKGEDPGGVSRDCHDLVEDLVQAGALSRSPQKPPELARAETLFKTNCQICHGPTGAADTPTAKTLSPHPANFQAAEVMDGLTPFKAFNVMTFGVSGTAMPSFSILSEQDRWALAFYLFTLRQPGCDHDPPATSLETLATTSDPQLARRYGAKDLACLRRRFPQPDEERSLLIARRGIDEAMRLSAAGQGLAAKKAVLDAYLNGVEPVEALLRSRDPNLVVQLEAAFGRTRVEAERGSPHVADAGRELLTLIDKARQSRQGAPTFASVFWLAALVVVREGFEATVVLAALLAVLKKMRQERHTRLVHAAWVSALACGAACFLFARRVLGGENRELLEGITALAAVAMLLYAAIWLNARANTRKFMAELREKMQGALGRNSAIGLFTVAFTAMFRESFETALFLQGLSLDSSAGALWGAGLGVVAMVALVLFVNRVGYKLPMQALFKASTALLFATAVILLGEGIHALQEVGTLPFAPMWGVRIEWLGLFPDALSLVPQLVLALAPIPYFAIKRAQGGTVDSGSRSARA
jgi:high-affinity iron transporter